MSTSRLELKSAFTVTPTGEITGIAWPFASPDRAGDIIIKGAFNTSSAPLPMLFGHDQNQPVGIWDSITESNAGLTVKGRLLIDQVERAKEVHALVKEGAITGLSIGFVNKKATSRKGGGRTIYKLDLREISIVSVPCHDGARINSVKDSTHMLDESDNTDQPDYAALETKLANIEGEIKSFNAITSRLDKMEARLNRPGNFAEQPKSEDLEKKAFLNFARVGVERMEALEVKALNVSSDSAGGFLFPPAFLPEIDKKLVQYSPIRSLARVMNVGGGEVLLPKRTGTLTASWVGETTPRPETQPTYGQQAFPVFEQACYVDVSNRLLEDSLFNIEAELAHDFGEEFARAESSPFLLGTGANTPSGMLLNADILANATPIPAGALTQASLIEVFHSLPSPYAQNAVWGMSRRVMGQVRALATAHGEPLWVDGLAAGNPPLLLGRPIVEFPEMPWFYQAGGMTPNTGAVPIFFGDLKAGFRIFDRVGVSLLRDPYTVQTSGLVRFHARRRVGGAVSKLEAIRFMKVTAS